MNKRHPAAPRPGFLKTLALLALAGGFPGRGKSSLAPRKATCPVCGELHTSGKEFCCAEHAREYRAERRHARLPAKNAVEGRRLFHNDMLRIIDTLEKSATDRTHLGRLRRVNDMYNHAETFEEAP